MQQGVVAALRDDEHEVYDFREPAPGERGFSWSEIDPKWQDWTPEQFVVALSHPIARRGFDNDAEAMWQADACVLVLPCGRSAHLEAGWMAGAGRWLGILLDDLSTPTPGHSMHVNVVCQGCSKGGRLIGCGEPEARAEKREAELMYRFADLVTARLEAIRAQLRAVRADLVAMNATTRLSWNEKIGRRMSRGRRFASRDDALTALRAEAGTYDAPGFVFQHESGEWDFTIRGGHASKVCEDAEQGGDDAAELPYTRERIHGIQRVGRWAMVGGLK